MFFLLSLSLPCVNWSSQEGCLFHSPEVLTPVLGPSFVLFSQAFPFLSFSHCHSGLLFPILTILTYSNYVTLFDSNYLSQPIVCVSFSGWRRSFLVWWTHLLTFAFAAFASDVIYFPKEGPPKWNRHQISPNQAIHLKHMRVCYGTLEIHIRFVSVPSTHSCPSLCHCICSAATSVMSNCVWPCGP